MEYPKGYVFELLEKGGPTDVREPYFMEAKVIKMQDPKEQKEKKNKNDNGPKGSAGRASKAGKRKGEGRAWKQKETEKRK